MTELIRRFRGLGVALVVLALSAGAVFASAPRFSPASNTEQGIEQPSGSPAASDDVNSKADEDSDEDGDEADTDTDAAETDEADGLEADSDASDTHGALVSEAAQASLDPRFDNRGEWVSCVAKLDKTTTVGTVDWGQVTDDCVAAKEAKDAAKEAKHAANVAKHETAKAKADAGKAKGQAAKGKTKTHGKPKG